MMQHQQYATQLAAERGRAMADVEQQKRAAAQNQANQQAAAEEERGRTFAETAEGDERSQTMASGGVQMRRLEAQAAPLRAQARLNWVATYLFLLICAGVLDIMGLIPVVDIAASILAIPYSAVRWIAIKNTNASRASDPQGYQMRMMMTIVGGAVEFIPVVNLLPIFTSFMITEWYYRAKKTNLAASKLKQINAQISALQRSLPR